MKYRMAAALLSLSGVFVSAYLYLYKLGKIGSLACGAGGCETVQLSRWSTFFGVDVALIGLAGYAALLVLSLAGLQPRWSESRGVSAMLIAASGVGLLFAIYLTYLELFIIHAICRWCVASAVIVAAVVVVAVLDRRRFSRQAAPGAA